jgi:hypothetical protein
MSSITEIPRDESTESVANDKKIIVEFDGPDDKWDPKNFSNFKKWVILIFVTLGAVVVTCASSMYVYSLRWLG